MATKTERELAAAKKMLRQLESAGPEGARHMGLSSTEYGKFEIALRQRIGRLQERLAD